MHVLPMVEEPTGMNDFAVLYWNHVGLEMNRITHSLGGPHTGPTVSSRALGLLHLAMHDAYFAVLGHTGTSDIPTYLPDGERRERPAGLPETVEEANAALSAAAVTILDLLYNGPAPNMSIAARNLMTSALSSMISAYRSPLNALSPAYEFGAAIARDIWDRLAIKPGDIGAGEGRYTPKQGRFQFRDEPGNPVRRVPLDPNDPSKGTRAQRVYHGPFYGTTVPEFAVTDPAGHRLAQWPAEDYRGALKEVVRLGGAVGQPKTERTPDQTVAALFWAYDGANLIGTPPRLYNQILRVISWEKRDTSKAPDDEAQNSEFVRLFALANTAMADAGKFSWLEKYRFELWRPLSGVREHDLGGTPTRPDGSTTIDEDADPGWLSFGAPETNTDGRSFKPPFPAYPSGHATFGAACFQIARLFYKDRDSLGFDDNGADAIAFSFVSDELNGISRDLYQPYEPTLPIEDQPGLVRTRVKRRFPSLWHAIYENGLSRIFLGVHWRFDAADINDLKKGEASSQGTAPATGSGSTEPVVVDYTTLNSAEISYSHVWTQKRGPEDDLPIGGVPLGLGIANDIWCNRMKAPGAGADVMPKMADTAV